MFYYRYTSHAQDDTPKGNQAMQGLLVFKDLGEAESLGFQFFDRRKDGMIVRKMTAGGWAMALVRKK